jgi:hypothetical protein
MHPSYIAVPTVICSFLTLCIDITAGFFHQPMDGYPAGFPVLIENALPNLRAIQMIQYLIDGNYLDSMVRVAHE